MKVEKGDKATPYVPHSSDTIYTSKGFGSMFAEDFSGYQKSLNVLNNPSNGGESPRYSSCTYFDGNNAGLSFTDSSFYSFLNEQFSICFWIKPLNENGNRSVILVQMVMLNLFSV